jgi:hypothetical protein
LKGFIRKEKGPPKMVESYDKIGKTLDMDTKGEEPSKEGKSGLKMLNGIQGGKGKTHEIGQKFQGVINTKGKSSNKK